MVQFAGHKKTKKKTLFFFEKLLKSFLAKHTPKYIQTYDLTFTTIIWSLLVILFSYLASLNIYWLLAVSATILMQYLTDLVDGEVGRIRNTGLIKWGFYMDHFLDYIFLSSIMIGYIFIFPENTVWLFFIMTLFGAFMVDSFLYFAATNKFRISHLGFGPTEARFLFILVNLLIVFLGKTYLAPLLPYVLWLSFFGLIYVSYKSHKEIWKIDMAEKKKIK